MINSCLVANSQPKQEYLFFHLGSRNGLVSNEVTCVTQDSRGFIWIATLNGLQRYDGRRFLSFNHIAGDSTSLPNNGIHSMYMDKKDRLWLKCQENRMGYFNTSDFTFHEVPVRYPEMALRDAESGFVNDADGNPMLVLGRKAILTYNEAAGDFDSKHNPFYLPVNWKPHAIWQDPSTRNYWIGCDSGLVKYSIHDKLMSYRGHNVSHDPVIDVYAGLFFASAPFTDRAGRYWVISWPPTKDVSFFSYDLATNKLTNWEPNLGKILNYRYHETFGLFQQQDGTLWTYGGGIFAKFNEKKNSFEWVQPDMPGEFSIRYDGIRHLFEDKEHNLWASTNKGLYRFNPAGQFIHAFVNKRINDEKEYQADVSDIYQLRNGDIITGTWGNALFAYDKDLNPVKREYIEQGMKLAEGMDWCVHERPNGDIWRGNQDGYLFIYHAATNKSERLHPSVFSGSTIRQITEDKDGNLWIGTQGGHLVKWDALTDSFYLLQKMHSIIYRIYTDRRGDIWVCTRSNGVYHLNNKDGSIIYNYTADGPKDQRLMLTTTSDIIQYDDSLFVVASGCLNILNIRTNKIHYISTDNGLPSNTVVNIVDDKHGYLWLTVESGLCSINMKNNIVTSYNENDGLSTINFNEASSCVLNDGRIAIGGKHEFVIFDPTMPSDIDLAPPNVTITGFELMNRWLKVDSLLSLPHISLDPGENSINIEYSTLTFQNMYGISYMMEGLDKKWIRKATGQAQAVYSYLPPGTYTFKVRCENGDGTYSNKITSFTIIVNPPFWKTWWFFCILGLTATGVIFWFDKLRLNKMVALQKVRSDIAGNLHEEVNTTLNNINLLSEMARIKADKEIERSKEYIEQISSKSHNMILAMDDILWSIDPDNDSMEKSLLRMMEFADVMKNLYGAHIEIALDKKVRSLRPDMKTRHEIFLIFKQALVMIVEQAGGRQTLVHIDPYKNKLSITLQDATASLDRNTNGTDEHIKAMHNRASYIGADLDIHYDGKGIAIILLVPVK